MSNVDITSFQCALADDFHFAKDTKRLKHCGHFFCEKCKNETSVLICKICEPEVLQNPYNANMSQKEHISESSLLAAMPRFMDELDRKFNETRTSIISIYIKT
jgi:hypothetical protein